MFIRTMLRKDLQIWAWLVAENKSCISNAVKLFSLVKLNIPNERTLYWSNLRHKDVFCEFLEPKKK